jgi:hypothetical protein
MGSDQDSISTECSDDTTIHSVASDGTTRAAPAYSGYITTPSPALLDATRAAVSPTVTTP